MHEPVPEIEPRVVYHLDDGRRLEDESPTDPDAVCLIELRYPCPKCDHPNVAAVTPPLIYGEHDRCDACDARHSLTGHEVAPFSIPYFDLPVTRVEDARDALSAKRRARVAGQHATDAALRRHQLLFYGSLIGVPLLSMVGLIAGSFGVIFLASTALGELAGLLAVMFLSAVAIVGGTEAMHRLPRRFYEPYTVSENAAAAAHHGEYAQHGRRIERGEEELNRPDADATADDGERDLLLDRR